MTPHLIANGDLTPVLANLTHPTVLVATVTGFFALLSTFGGIWAKRRFDTIETHTQEARDQVKNSHDTNLRDDIDRILNALEAQGKSLGGIRDDLRVEREERIALSARLDTHLAWQARKGD